MSSTSSPPVVVQPTTVDGTIVAPPSKSASIRAIAAATLAEGTSTIVRASRCDDARAALAVAAALGARREPRASGALEEEGAEQLTLTGVPGVERVTPQPLPLRCGESALTLRLFAPIAARLFPEVRLEGSGTLLERSVEMLEPPLSALGVACRSRDGRLPLELRGTLRAGAVEIDGSLTSQALSGLLMALPTCAGDSTIAVRDLVSEGYAELTRTVMQAFGVEVPTARPVAGGADALRFEVPGGQRYRPSTFTVEGDWSGAAFLLVAGAIAGRVRIEGVAPESNQPDRVVLDALERAGAVVCCDEDGTVVEQGPLRGFVFDATSCPDLLPPLCVLACGARGRSVLRGAGRLAHKESHRAETLCSELGKLGAGIERVGDELRVQGGPLSGGAVSACGDHRIAMACAVAALRASGPVAIAGASCVSKSYPAFFDHLAALTGMES